MLMWKDLFKFTVIARLIVVLLAFAGAVAIGNVLYADYTFLHQSRLFAERQMELQRAKQTQIEQKTPKVAPAEK